MLFILQVSILSEQIYIYIYIYIDSYIVKNLLLLSVNGEFIFFIIGNYRSELLAL